jgi:hypothetical protein
LGKMLRCKSQLTKEADPAAALVRPFETEDAP